MGNKRKWYSILLIGLVLILATSVVACAQPAPAPAPPPTPTPKATPAPASFTVSAVSIVPDTCKAGESVTVSATVTNSGGSKGIYNVIFKVNGIEEARMEVILDAGGSQKVSHTLKKAVAGIYSVDVNGKTGQFAVFAPLPPLPAPASFAISSISVIPGEVKPGEQVTISAVVTNSGGSEGKYTVILKVNNLEEARKEIALGASKTETVTLTTKKSTAGKYTVDVNGLTGSFVVAPTQTVPPTDIVYITRTGEKYHRAGCQYLSKSQIPIERAEAIKKGYTPCSVCRP